MKTLKSSKTSSKQTNLIWTDWPAGKSEISKDLLSDIIKSDNLTQEKSEELASDFLYLAKSYRISNMVFMQVKSESVFVQTNFERYFDITRKPANSIADKESFSVVKGTWLANVKFPPDKDESEWFIELYEVI